MQDHFKRENREKYSYIACSPEDVRKIFEFVFFAAGKIEINKKPANIRIEENSGGFLIIYVNNKGYQVEMLESNHNNYQVRVNGNSYNYSIETKLSYKRKKNLSKNISETTKYILLAPMPGKIVDILSSENSVVKKGESIIILEAMKMQNEILAASNSTLIKIHVSIGDVVNKGDLLMSFE